MRHIGSLDNESDARSLHSYLVTQKIRCMVEEEDEKWSIWIYDEDQVDRGREELAAFREAPGDPKYSAAVREATRIQKEEQKQLKEHQKRHVNVREQWQKPMASRTPVTFGLIILALLACIVTTSLGGQNGGGMFGPPLCNNARAAYLKISAGFSKSLPEVRNGEIWRLLTPIFLHGNLIHILFNMIWTRQLGSAIEVRRGSWNYLGIVVFCAIVSNLAQNFITGPNFVGMSGVGYGFFGYIYIKSRFDPSAGLFMPQNLLFMGVFWLLLGFAGMMNTANWCHLFGMFAGGFLAYIPVALRTLKAG